MIFLTNFIGTIKLYNQIWWNFFFNLMNTIKIMIFAPFWIFPDGGFRWILDMVFYGIWLDGEKISLVVFFVGWKPIFTRLFGRVQWYRNSPIWIYKWPIFTIVCICINTHSKMNTTSYKNDNNSTKARECPILASISSTNWTRVEKSFGFRAWTICGL